MLVAGIDFETTGLNVNEDHIIEVGVVLWDTDRKLPMILFSAMVHGDHIKTLDPKITEITGITDADLKKWGQPVEAVFPYMNSILEQCEYVVAHNGNLFDKPLYLANCKRHGIEPSNKAWIDTSCDVEYRADITTKKLKHLAAEHDFLNPFSHRALFDVLTMLKVCTPYDWKKIVEYSKAPTLVIRADSTFQQKELVKKQNYRWDNDTKEWKKSIKDFQLEEARKAAIAAGFKVTVLKGGK